MKTFKVWEIQRGSLYLVGCEELGSFIVGWRGIDYNQNRLNRPSGQIRAAAFDAMYPESCGFCMS